MANEEKLTITFSGGNVTVDGPIGNKLMCYALLEMARDIIKDYKPSPIIQPAKTQINGSENLHSS